ncbi:MAG: ChaN family lipoprotein [Burkholderiales bacterium]|nr:ChaN family lipoprotein [Burkholderiales bacterium]
MASALAWHCAAAAPSALPASPEALAAAMQGHAVVLLGEVHDNPAQHALRVAALRVLVARGARPALAFEQFDRERQDAIDRARRDRPRDVDYLIAQAQGAPGWQWELYKPFIALALEYDLPIVAANLSRAEAMKLARAPQSDQRPPLPAGFLRVHEDAIAAGHCNLLPADALPGMARAQIARDRALAQAIAPFADRGVVLLTGNGHARTDVGVAHWLPADVRAKAISIALLERGGASDEPPSAFDTYILTDAQPRPDPCAELRKRFKPGS